MRRASFAEGEYIVRQGETSPIFCLVQEGTVSVLKQAEGEQEVEGPPHPSPVVGAASAESDSVGVVADSCWRVARSVSARSPDSIEQRRVEGALRRNVKYDPTRPLHPRVTAL